MKTAPAGGQACIHCSTSFQVTDDDRAFYKKIDVPEPGSCPQCRLIRRLQERNARKLYYRQCDKTGKKIISTYHQNQPFPVYDQAVWWGGDWDAMDYGQDVDFSRPFFEQFLELKNKVPHFSVFIIGGTLQNSDFTNCTGYLKNCYLISESDYDEDCAYSNRIYHSKNLLDCTNGHESEKCYQCIDFTKCFNLLYSQECENCTDSFFLKNCIGMKDSIGCINQRQKQYMIFNKQLSKEEYEKQKAELKLDSYESIQALSKKVQAFFTTQPHKATIGEHNQNVVGDHVHHSKNAYQCYDSKDLEDCKYCVKVASNVKNCMDYTSWGFKAELMYETSSCGDNAYNIQFCTTCTTNITNLTYCTLCTGSNDLFGCVGLKKKKFCILNKQYSESDYHDLRAKLIDHMKSTGEWGQFFPMSLCSYGYNETIAMDHFPLTKEEALARGYHWSDYEMEPPEVEKTVLAGRLPERTADIPDDVLNWAINCEVTGKPFKLTKPEFKFYQEMSIPIPRRHPDTRHKDRMGKRPPYQLFDQACGKCQKAIQTTYCPSRPETVYCEACYLGEVH